MLTQINFWIIRMFPVIFFFNITSHVVAFFDVVDIVCDNFVLTRALKIFFIVLSYDSGSYGDFIIITVSSLCVWCYESITLFHCCIYMHLHNLVLGWFWLLLTTYVVAGTAVSLLWITVGYLKEPALARAEELTFHALQTKLKFQ